MSATSQIATPAPPPTGQPVAELMRRARIAACEMMQDGAAAYSRARMLPRLLALEPQAMRGAEPATTRHIILHLLRAVRSERARASHWTYDLNRHIGLNQALRAEKARLVALCTGLEVAE